MAIKDGYKETEVGVIPKDWEVYSLCNIGKFKNGINKNSESFGHGTPFVNLMDVFGFSYLNSNKHYGLVDCTNFEKDIYDLKKGDVIFIRSSVKPSGVGLTAVVEEDLEETVYSGFLIRFRDNGFIDINYKRHCFYGERFRNSIISSSTVSANTNINQDSLKNLCIPLPPLPEQRAIAEALSDVDALIAAQEALIAKKRAIKQGVMQELLTGKRRLPGFSGKWETKKLGEISKIIMGQSPSSFYYNHDSVGLPLIQGNADIHERKTIIRIYTSQITKKCTKDDIIMSVRAPVGEIAKSMFDACLGRGVCAISYPNQFLYHFLVFFEPKWVVYSKGSTFDSVNSDDVKNLEILIPHDMDEQISIASMISDMDDEIDVLEQKLNKTKAIKLGMMQELLTGHIRLVGV